MMLLSHYYHYTYPIGIEVAASGFAVIPNVSVHVYVETVKAWLKTKDPSTDMDMTISLHDMQFARNSTITPRRQLHN